MKALTHEDAVELIQRGIACGVMKWEDGSLVARINGEALIYLQNNTEAQAAERLAAASRDLNHALAGKFLTLSALISSHESDEQRKARYERIGELVDAILPPYGTTKNEDIQSISRRRWQAEREAALWREAENLLKAAKENPDEEGNGRAA